MTKENQLLGTPEGWVPYIFYEYSFMKFDI